MNDSRVRFSIVLAVAAAAVAAACSGSADPCSTDLALDCASSSSGASSSSTGSSSGASSSSTGSSSGDGGASSGSTSGSDGGALSGDGGGDAGDGGSSSGGGGAFVGAPAYVQGQSLINSKAGSHQTAQAARGLPCMQCHVQGVLGPNHQFLLGGTIYTDTAGTIPAGPGVEVRVLDGSNKAVSVYTDAYGNFAVRSAAGTPSFPMKTGVRTATTTVNMAAAVANGDCNSSSCHSGSGGGTARIHIP